MLWEKLVNNSKHISYAQFFFLNCAGSEDRWKNNIEWVRRIICWIPKARSTHLHCIILIAFQLKMFENAALLREILTWGRESSR
jgi:hypothetical protein